MAGQTKDVFATESSDDDLLSMILVTQIMLVHLISVTGNKQEVKDEFATYQLTAINDENLARMNPELDKLVRDNVKRLMIILDRLDVHNQRHLESS